MSEHMAGTLVQKVLLVDDEPDIVELLRYNLEREGYAVQTALNGKDALKAAKSNRPDLIVLDIMMPGMDGVEVCMQLRQLPEFKNTVITFLTARGEDYSQIAGFDAGADDYITKPVRPKVFVSKVKALLKRSGADRPEGRILESNGVKVDLERVMVYVGDQELQLPKKEFELLVLLIGKPGKVFKRDEIYSQIWGNELFVGDRTIDVHIRKLREKIGDDRIKTIKGIGYKFDA
ncbi:MAG TPA: response regulator transcription factor [Flavobacteriales bacterium]|jgi:two-component system, OmpR family, alkaline phosphatase synthesis response regulator PhoP|nr:response regulator transcription factor [Flavobacteriales bacterium]